MLWSTFRKLEGHILTLALALILTLILIVTATLSLNPNPNRGEGVGGMADGTPKLAEKDKKKGLKSDSLAYNPYGPSARCLNLKEKKFQID
jgi:hypothetical protein